MRILYIALSCGPNLGSEDAVGWNIPLEALRFGHDVTVLTRSDKRKEIEGYIAKNPDISYPKFIYRELPRLATYCKGPLYSIRAKMWCTAISRELPALCQKLHFDVVHQITPVEFRSIVDMAEIYSLKVVGPMGGGGEIAPVFQRAYLRVRDRIVEMFRSISNKNAVRSRALKKSLVSHDVVFASNQETKAIIQEMGWKGPLIVQSEVAAKRLVARAPKNGRGFVIGAAGRLHYGKGYLFLLDVIASMNVPDLELRIAGEGPDRSRIETRIQELGLQDTVKLLGRLSYHEMEEFYADLDVFAFPSFREATGTVLIEAMAAGVPVVAFDAFGAHEILYNKAHSSLVSFKKELNQIIFSFSKALLNSTFIPNVPPKTWNEYTKYLLYCYQFYLDKK